MTSVPDYVELRCRSAFSFLAGASLPEDLVERAAALGYDTLALADARGVYGAPRFFQAARCAGLRALVGAEVAVAGAGSLWLLVEERAGYKNLCRLLTAGALGRVKGEALVTWAEVEEHAAGLHCLAGGAEGPLAGADAAANLPRLQRLFGARLAVDVHRHGERGGERLARRLADLAAAHRVPVVATNDVRHAAPEGRPLLDVLTCIRLGTTLDQAGRRLLANVERHLKPPAEMAALFRDMPDAIRQSRRIAERCAFTLADLGYRFPEFPLAPGETPIGHLRALTYAGARDRYRTITATVISYRTRSAVREAGKALGLSLEQVDRLAKLLRAHGYSDEHDELGAQLRAGGVDPEAPRIGLLVEIVRQMQGLPRHLGQHTGGMVIAAGRLDEVVEVAIIRPGPIVGQMVNPYLKRRAGREPVGYAHPSLEPILACTLGVPLFQEQLLRIAMTVAGFTGGEAEELRRAMGFKRSVQRMSAIEEKLRTGLATHGIHGERADDLVRSITSFALYGFPESHAASFALLAYASAYLKAHHPAAFYAALLNNQPMGFYHPSTLVKDAQRRGVRFQPIDVQVSDWNCTVERDGAIRLGLRYVNGLRQEVGKKIASEAPGSRLQASGEGRCP